jgi:hypothetical protein
MSRIRSLDPTPGPRLEPLVRKVEERTGGPVDRWAVVVALEADGWRDLDARREFGVDDVFALADRVFPLCGAPAREEAPPRTGVSWAPVRESRAWRMVAGLVRESVVALPIAVQIVAVLTLGYSLWAWVEFTEAEATVVALGTLASFIVTGGFVQCIGREGQRYLAMDSPLQASRACSRLRSVGLSAVVVVAVVALVGAGLFPFYPLDLMSISLGYFLLLSVLWVVLALLYVLKRHLAIAVFTLCGLLPVYAVMEFTGWGIYAAHGLGLLVTIGLSGAYGEILLRRRIGRTDPGDRRSWLPPVAVEFHDLLPYFLYGVGLFAFLFVDRVIAWSVTAGDPSPYVIWFRTPYELGVDWALIPLLLLFGVVHHTSKEFSDWSSVVNRDTSALPIDEAVRRFRGLYSRHLVMLGVAGALGTVAGYELVLELVETGRAPILAEVVADPVTRRVYGWAAASYAMAAVGLYHVLLFFALSRPWFAVTSIAGGLAANVVVGLLASRLIAYEFAVAGVLAGGLVFMVVSYGYVRRMLGNYAYYCYSAL